MGFHKSIHPRPGLPRSDSENVSHLSISRCGNTVRLLCLIEARVVAFVILAVQTRLEPEAGGRDRNEERVC